MTMYIVYVLRATGYEVAQAEFLRWDEAAKYAKEYLDKGRYVRIETDSSDAQAAA